MNRNNFRRLGFLHKVLLCIVFLWAYNTGKSHAQKPNSNLRSQIIRPQLPEQQLDSLTIIPHSVVLQNTQTKEIIGTIFYTINNNFIQWNVEETKTIPAFEKQSFLITYRVFPYQFTAKNKHLDTLKMARSPSNAGDIAFDYRPYKDDEVRLLEESNMDYNGSFSRGLSLGNNQSVVLNSNFNLQMAGSLGDVEILAAISDSNIPLQPEGNTQQLQDFDKVFIQIKKEGHQLLAGDYEMTNGENYFLRYYKKLQGASYTNKTSFAENKELETKASVAISRGKFARNTLVVQEGNQGPYRLEGSEGEQFIILLAGTERVYVDGQVKKRGIEYDYIIDYNRGDITFTANQLITKDRRVIIEFEYSDQNFLRSLYAVQSDYKTDKMRLHFNLFSQQDSKNTSGLTELSASQKQKLADVGDQLNEALVSGLRPLDENADPIAYRLIDTLVNGILYDSILVFASNREEAQYSARFSEVGASNGNYIREISATNGTVFRWVEPDLLGNSQGDYEPIIRLLAPLSHQIYSAGLDYQLSRKSSIQTEVALSNQDLNRFSSLDSNDNLGLASFINYNFQTPLSKKDTSWQLTTDIAYEFKEADFRQINPYRNQEFARDWNIDNRNTLFNEHLGKASFLIERFNLGSLKYEFNTFLQGKSYTGNRHFSQLNIAKKGFSLFAEGNLLYSKTALEESQFFRPKIDIAQTFAKANKLKIGAYAERERNERMQADTLSKTSFYYDFLKFYAENKSRENLQWDVFFAQRWDYTPLQTDFVEATKANNIGFNGNWNQSRFSRLRWNFTYRQLDVRRPDLSTEQNLETYLGKLEYQAVLWKGALKSNTTYEIGAGQEPKLEYNYLKVNPGEGVYQWNDYNQDSLQQVNEFEIAVNSDQAQFVRVALLTNDFVRTNTVGFNQSLNLNPKVIWHQKEKGIFPFLNRFSSQSTFKINRKTRRTPDVQLWNPFQTVLNDTSLVATTASIRNTLFFNRTNPKYDFQLGQYQTQNRIILTTGSESRASSEQFFRARWNLWTPFTLIAYASQGERLTDSAFFNERDYEIEFQKVELSGNIQTASKWQVQLQYLWQEKNNVLGNQEVVKQQEFSFKTTYNKSTKTALSLEAAYAKIAYEGATNTAVSFALLESLQPGQNFRWNISLDRQLAKNLQLNIGYEGRKNGQLKVVHIGRMQMRAVF